MEENQEIQTPDTNPAITTPSHPQSRSKFILFGLGAVVLLSLGLIGGYFLSSKKNNVSSVMPSPVINEPTKSSSEFPIVTPIQTISGSSYTTDVYTLEANKIKKLTTYTYPGNSIFSLDAPTITKNGYIYYANDNRILRYSLNSKTTELVYEKPEEDRGISRIDTKFEPYVYITKMQKNYDNKADQTVNEFSLQTRAERIIGPVPEVVYGNPRYLLRSNTADIITSIGGDGCGGGGPVYKFVGDTRSQITQIGMGCGDGPNLIGVLKDQNSLLLLDRKMTEEISDDRPFGNEILLAISQLNVDIEKKETLFDLSSMQIKNAAVLLDTDNKQIAIITEENLWILDIPSKTIKKKITKPQIATFQDLFADDKFYEMDHVNRELSIFDLNSGSIEKVSWEGTFSDNVNPVFIDILNGEPVFYATRYNE